MLRKWRNCGARLKNFGSNWENERGALGLAPNRNAAGAEEVFKF